MTRKGTATIAFVAHLKHQRRLFDVIARALPGDIQTRLFFVRRDEIRTRLYDLLHKNRGASSDIIDRVAEYDGLRGSLGLEDAEAQQVRARIRKHAAYCYELFLRKLAGVDLLVVWNGYKLPESCAVAAAKEIGASTIHCENGPLPGTLTMDPAGINFAGSLTGKPAGFYESIDMDREKANLMSHIELQQRPLRKAGNGELTQFDQQALPERYAFFAMQVHDDSQVLLFSPRFRTMESVVPYVAERVAAYNSRTGDTLRLVVKEHPSDFGRVDYSAMQSMHPEVLFLRARPVRDLIDGARAVITLNSTVGIEALLRLRPVITLGDAFYNVPGLVRHVEPNEDLADVLGATIDRPINEALAERFLYFMRYEYLVPVAKDNADRASVEPAVQRIMDVLQGRLSWT